MTKATINFDGSCWPNPGGPMGMGITISIDDGSGNVSTIKGSRTIATSFLDPHTNNVAEYKALLWALSILHTTYFSTLTIVGDSKLVIKQMSGEWAISEGKPFTDIAKHCAAILAKINENATIRFSWVPRESNTEADMLSKPTPYDSKA